MTGPPLWGRDSLEHPARVRAAGLPFPALCQLSEPYLWGLCWAVLGLGLEAGLEAVRGPGHQGQGECSRLCRNQ